MTNNRHRKRSAIFGAVIIAGSIVVGLTGLATWGQAHAAANDNHPPGPGAPAPGASIGAEKATEILMERRVVGKDPSHVIGLNPDFRQRLATMFAAMPSDIRASTRILSGYRSVDHQARLFAAALRKYGSEAKARRWVAPPGRSNHNRGLAVDLKYGSRAAVIWAHKHARAFGLHFPMSHENWHIEPIGSRPGR